MKIASRQAKKILPTGSQNRQLGDKSPLLVTLFPDFLSIFSFREKYFFKKFRDLQNFLYSQVRLDLGSSSKTPSSGSGRARKFQARSTPSAATGSNYQIIYKKSQKLGSKNIFSFFQNRKINGVICVH